MLNLGMSFLLQPKSTVFWGFAMTINLQRINLQRMVIMAYKDLCNLHKQFLSVIMENVYTFDYRRQKDHEL
jgi:hypothetical protein